MGIAGNRGQVAGKQPVCTHVPCAPGNFKKTSAAYQQIILFPRADFFEDLFGFYRHAVIKYRIALNYECSKIRIRINFMIKLLLSKTSGVTGKKGNADKAKVVVIVQVHSYRV